MVVGIERDEQPLRTDAFRRGWQQACHSAVGRAETEPSVGIVFLRPNPVGGRSKRGAWQKPHPHSRRRSLHKCSAWRSRHPASGLECEGRLSSNAPHPRSIVHASRKSMPPFRAKRPQAMDRTRASTGLHGLPRRPSFIPAPATHGPSIHRRRPRSALTAATRHHVDPNITNNKDLKQAAARSLITI